jgi:hypothetical protein
MNIFILDQDIVKSAQYHIDKHIVKMPLETAQLLCTAHHISGSDYLDDVPYRATHKNHPSAVWARKSLDNYMWLCDFGLELCTEYTYRYDKVHKCEAVISWCREHQPRIESYGLTEFAQAMPDQYKSHNAVTSYRDYYKGEKKHLFNWKKRDQPNWIEG